MYTVPAVAIMRRRSTLTQVHDFPARRPMVMLLEQTIPGTSQSTRHLREEVLDFAASFTARSVLLLGPIGVGKSTLARLIGLLKRMAPLTESEAAQRVADKRYDAPNRVDIRLMPWYVELALTGLVESLAEAQLFGVARGAYTGAVEHPGVFERAQGAKRGKVEAGAALTGGVVFLDEVGDLSLSLQAKLLPVLTEAVFYRVGGEGDDKYSVEYRGTTITASWRRLDTGRMRPDLLSRISSHVIEVPGLNDRAEDFDALFEEVQRSVIERFKAKVDHACLVDPAVDKEYWRGQKEKLAPLTPAARRRLGAVDWHRHGHLRGLEQGIERILIAGRDVEEVIEQLPIVNSDTDDDRRRPADFVGRLLERSGDGTGLAGHVRALEVEQRAALSDILLSNSATRRGVAKALAIDERKLMSQAQQLHRRRRRAGD